jgi:AcrR family transcriptional regulator
MPRTKTATDADILDAAARVILRIGPTSLRLADVADEVGLAPATLLQRFKSKRALLLAVAAHGTKAIADDFASRRARAASPLDALLAISPKVRSLTRSRRGLTNKLAFLQLGLSDRAFQRHLNAHHRAAKDELRKLLDAAIEIGELRPCNTRTVAHALVAVWHGSLLLWALTRGGAVEAHIRNDMEAVLAPYRADADELRGSIAQRSGAEGARLGGSPRPSRAASVTATNETG